jgi:hypothetical protein
MSLDGMGIGAGNMCQAFRLAVVGHVDDGIYLMITHVLCRGDDLRSTFLIIAM